MAKLLKRNVVRRRSVAGLGRTESAVGRAGTRRYVEAQRPNGDRTVVGLPTSHLDLIFTVEGPVEITVVKSAKQTKPTESVPRERADANAG